MTFDSSVFWPAFKSAGMLTEVAHQPSQGGQVVFDAKFNRPDEVVLDGMVHSTDFSIEYQSVDVLLKRGDVVLIGAVAYKIRQTPKAKGDGTFVFALLEEVAP